jgi:abortive infection alpha-like protein
MEGNIKSTTEVVKGIVDSVPIYKDLCQPAIQEVGKGLHTLSKIINMALLPLSKKIWEYEKIEKEFKKNLEVKLSGIPQENIMTPDPRVAGPLIESLKYTAQEDELREMYTNLLASSMNKKKNNDVHPSFVEIIKQLLSDEAKLIKEISDSNDGTHGLLSIKILEVDKEGWTIHRSKFCKFYDSKTIENKSKISLYLENLERLKLIEIPNNTLLTDKKFYYEPLENHILITQELEELSAKGKKTEFENGYLQLTEFGKSFVKVCI